MQESGALLRDLAIVLCVAAFTTVLFRRLRQPVVLGYLLAGVIVGPNLPIPLFADEKRIHTLSELGVILVMFSVGLEFSIRKLARLLPTAGLTGLIQIGLMSWLGYLAGKALGWTETESLFTGAILAISSTMIVAKAFEDQRRERKLVEGKLVDVVFGVLIVQDLAAVLLLAILTGVISGAGLEGPALFRALGRLAAFLVGLLAVGLVTVPRAIRTVARFESSETLLVASIGICFASSLLARELGYSVALGAFLAGSLVAESGEVARVEHLIRPVRDMFAAVFFVSIGMIVDPEVLLGHWPAVVVLTIVVLVGQSLSVSIGSFLVGSDVRTSLQAGMSLAQIGEFSFIVAGLGLTSGAVGSHLFAVTVAVSAVTAFTTPWLIRASGPIALYLDRRLPRPLQTFVALYGSWLEDVRSRGGRLAPHVRLRRRLVRLLAVDALVLAAIVIGTSIAMERAVELLARHFSLSRYASEIVVISAALLLATPFSLGALRSARALLILLAAAGLPRTEKGQGVDFAGAPRRAFVVALQLVLLAVLGVPLLALTQPFLPRGEGLLVLLPILGFLAIKFWRSAANLQEHVRAGAEVVVEALQRQARPPEQKTLEEVEPLVPGLGDIEPMFLRPDSRAVGKTLAELNLRGLTGASVIAIQRGSEGVVVPTGHETLRAGDVLALAGTEEACDSARAMLAAPQGAAEAPRDARA